MFTGMEPKILMVSPDGELCDGARSVFSQRGCVVLCAGTGLGGLNAARLAQPDLVVLDDELPDLDGSIVCDLLRAQLSTRRVPVIILVPTEKSMLCQDTSDANAPLFLPRTIALEVLSDRVVGRFGRASAVTWGA